MPENAGNERSARTIAIQFGTIALMKTLPLAGAAIDAPGSSWHKTCLQKAMDGVGRAREKSRFARDCGRSVATFLRLLRLTAMSRASAITAASDAQGSALRMPASSVDLQSQWFAAARKGDRVAFGRLVHALQDRLYNAVSRLVNRPEDAMDVTQEAFAKALANIGECRGDSQPYTWMFRIAMNVAISDRRKQAVRKAVSLEAETRSSVGDDQMTSLRMRLAGKGPSPFETATKNETIERVRMALERLEPAERTILVMRDVDGMDYAEMASVLDVPLGTLKSRLFRARVALRTIIETMESSTENQ